MTNKHICCQCVVELKEILRQHKHEKQNLVRDLKNAQRRIHRLKTQKQKLIEGKKQLKVKKLTPSFFKSL